MGPGLRDVVGAAVAAAVLSLACAPGSDSRGKREAAWDAPPPRVVSDWERESRFTYNLHSDVDRRGRFVAFQSSVKDGPTGVYLRDMRSRRITRLDVWYTGDQPAPGTARDQRIYRFGSGAPSISDNGRFVAFDSRSPFLVPGDVNRASDVFLYDRKTARLRLVSATSDGVQADGGVSTRPSRRPASSSRSPRAPAISRRRVRTESRSTSKTCAQEKCG